jgi:hypothetical protein
MRKLVLAIVGVSAVLSAWLMPASAMDPYDSGLLTMRGWFNSHYRVDSNLIDNQAGPFRWEWNSGGVITAIPLYCMDINHYFYWNVPFAVDRYIIPPDPNPGFLPYNTDEAAYIYHAFGNAEHISHSWFVDGFGAISKEYWATGVQLALWEVSHDQQWYTFGSDWLNNGYMYLTDNNTPLAVATAANYMLEQLHPLVWINGEHHIVTPPSSCMWYQPTTGQGQGQIGDNMIPEPGTMLLLGIGLVGCACVLRRHRKRS